MDAVSLDIFLAGVWQMVIVLLSPLNVGVSPCFHCTVLVPA